MAKSKRKRTWPPIPDDALVKALRIESDRGCVLVAAAFLDEQIKTLLEIHYATDREALLRLLEGMLSGENMSVPYGSATWAIAAAESEGLIKPKPIGKALRKIAQLRNEFAHLAHRGDLELADVHPILQALKEHAADLTRPTQIARSMHVQQPFTEARILFVGLALFLRAGCLGRSLTG